MVENKVINSETLKADEVQTTSSWAETFENALIITGHVTSLFTEALALVLGEKIDTRTRTERADQRAISEIENPILKVLAAGAYIVNPPVQTPLEVALDNLADYVHGYEETTTKYKDSDDEDNGAGAIALIILAAAGITYTAYQGGKWLYYYNYPVEEHQDDTTLIGNEAPTEVIA